MKTGLQLYTVRDYMEKDFFGTIKKVAEIGFKGVEFAGYYDKDLKEVRKFIDDLGLICTSSHLGMPTKENYNKVCDELDILGTKNWVINYCNFDTTEHFMDTFEKFKAASELLATRGIKCLFHNHWLEHTQKPFGKPFFEYGLENIDNLYSQLDLAWTLVGGYDPEERVKSYNDKIALLHCKDCKMETFESWSQKSATRIETSISHQVPNGDGDAKIKECVAASKAEWAIVELDFAEGSLWDAIEKSYKFLKEECGCEGNK